MWRACSQDMRTTILSSRPSCAKSASLGDSCCWSLKRLSSMDRSGSCSFFFQAEDGIRDLTVTGVQTCALPIWAELFSRHHDHREDDRAGAGDERDRGQRPEGDRGATPSVAAEVDEAGDPRSEERRVGKECRSRWSPYH